MTNLRILALLDDLGGRLLVFAILALAVAQPLAGCKHAQDLGVRIVDCTEQSVRDKGLAYVGRVNDVLANHTLSDSDARGELVALGVQAGEDIIGCLLRDQGAKFAASSSTNPGDTVSALAARRAQARLAELQAEGWGFTAGGSP